MRDPGKEFEVTCGPPVFRQKQSVSKLQQEARENEVRLRQLVTARLQEETSPEDRARLQVRTVSLSRGLLCVGVKRYMVHCSTHGVGMRL